MDQEKKLSLKFFLVGCFILAIASIVVFKLLEIDCPNVIHMVVLKWILPLASGFAVWSFAGALTVKAHGVIQSLVITATGGFGVWLISILVLIPNAGWDQPCGETIEPVIEVTRRSKIEINNCGKQDMQVTEVIEDKHKLTKGSLDTIKVLGFENKEGGHHDLKKLEHFTGQKWVEIIPSKRRLSGNIYEIYAVVPLKNNIAKVRYTWVQNATNGPNQGGIGIRKKYTISKIDSIVTFPSKINFLSDDVSWFNEQNGAEAENCVKEIDKNLFKFHCGLSGGNMRLEKDKTYGVIWEWSPQVFCN